DGSAKRKKPLAHDLLCPPLRHHPWTVVRFGFRRLARVGHSVLTLALAVAQDHADRIRAAGGPDGIDDAEVFEHFHGARLNPLPAGGGRRCILSLDHQWRRPTASQVDTQRQPGWAGTHYE